MECGKGEKRHKWDKNYFCTQKEVLSIVEEF
jgi:hypothetical protein